MRFHIIRMFNNSTLPSALRRFSDFVVSIVVVVLALCAFASSSAASTKSCFDVFNRPLPTHGLRPAFEESMLLDPGHHRNSKYTFLRRVGEIKDGHYDAWLTHHFWNYEQGFMAEVSRINQIKTSTELVAPAPRAGLEAPWAEAERSLDFVIETYRDRRPHWTPQFLAKLRMMAHEYLKDSTYITVLGWEGEGPSQKTVVRGSIRYIRERDGLLPMERYLGIRIDVGNDAKVEPGNLAISKKASGVAWPELMMQLLGDAASKNSDGRENRYLTYADVYSKSLYSRMGYTPVPLERMQLSEGLLIKDGAIVVDGISWTPMEASQATLENLFASHVNRLKADDFLISQMKARKIGLRTLSKSAYPAQFFESPIQMIKGNLVQAQIEIQSRHGSIWGKLTINQKSSGDENWKFAESHTVANLSIDSFPMRSGDLNAPKPAADYFKKRLRQRFENGRFSYKHVGGGAVELETTEDFSAITGVTVLGKSKFKGMRIEF